MNYDCESIERALYLTDSSEISPFLKVMFHNKVWWSCNADSGSSRIDEIDRRGTLSFPSNSEVPTTIKVTTDKDRTKKYVSEASQ